MLAPGCHFDRDNLDWVTSASVLGARKFSDGWFRAGLAIFSKAAP